MALGLFAQGVRSVSYIKYEQLLKDLLREFGPNRLSLHPEYPFWRLQNDGVWEVVSQRPMLRRASNSDIPRTELRSADAEGCFPQPLQKQLLKNPRLIWQIAQLLLRAHFPASLHEDILGAVGLPFDVTSTSLRRKRDTAFRKNILQAYKNCCAVCGFDLRIGTATIGLEAAHIMWHQAAGPDNVTNGIALCCLHHKLFDLGAFTITENFQILISASVSGTSQLDWTLLRYHNSFIQLPVDFEQYPSCEYLKWHQKEVFKAALS